MNKVIKVGSRDSQLALAQTQLVIDTIQKYHKELSFEIVALKTTGDKILNKKLEEIGGKGLFVKELHEALFEHRIDFAVHSLKDVPYDLPQELPIIAYSKREEAQDVLVIAPDAKETFEKGVIGTSSKRRVEQLKELYPEATFKSIRGNVQTRLKKLSSPEYDATVLAYAGIKRLHMEEIIDKVFTIEEVLPAAGQAIMAVQGRTGEDYGYLACVNDPDAAYAAKAERSFVKYLEGGCTSPTAAYAYVEENQLTLLGKYYMEKEGRYLSDFITGEKEQAEILGCQLAAKLKEQEKQL